MKRSTLGWPHIAGLGISLVVAGQFSGWNYGLAAGWGNMVAATGLMALFCFGLALCVAELAAARPHAGGLYTYCQEAFGDVTGYVVGIVIFAALAISTGAAATFIAAYSQNVLGFGGFPLKVLLFLSIAGLHLRGAGEAMRWMVGAGLLSLLCILIFLAAMAPHFSPLHLTSPHYPIGLTPGGVFSCVPFGIWLFISVEQTAAASEEVEDPARTIPRGMIAAIGVLLSTAMGILLLAAGGGGIGQIAHADDPLYAALVSPLAGNGHSHVAMLVGLGGIMGLLATMFSLIYSASRQLYALARDGHLPAFVARTNDRGAPRITVPIVAAIGICTSMAAPERIMLCVVLALTASYIVLLAAFIRQRTCEPHRHRPFRAWGGRVTALLCIALAMLVLSACFQADTLIVKAFPLFIILALLVRALTGLRPDAATGPEESLADV
nr:APC family permease [Novosphingobium rosa]